MNTESCQTWLSFQHADRFWVDPYLRVSGKWERGMLLCHILWMSYDILLESFLHCLVFLSALLELFGQIYKLDMVLTINFLLHIPIIEPGEV